MSVRRDDDDSDHDDVDEGDESKAIAFTWATCFLCYIFNVIFMDWFM